MKTGWLVLLCGALYSSPALGQGSSTLTGNVTDQTQAAIPLVRILLVSQEAGVRRETVTNDQGVFTISALSPRNYSVHAEIDGFKKAVSSVEVGAGSTVRLDLVLVPSDSRQVVEVNADPPVIETQTGMVSAVFTEKELSSMPLFGRNVLEAALSIAGVGGDIGSDEGGIFQDVPSSAAGLSITGGRAGSTAIMADGTNATSVGIGRATVTFTPELIQEVQVITSTFSAKYGVSGGGVINTVSRAGTDQLRGSAYWFNRNPLFSAHRFNRPIPPQEKRNEAGATISGPVIIPHVYNGKKRTFFFVGFEPKRWFDAVDIYDRFPAAEERLGDFRNSYLAPGQRRPLLYQQVRCMPSPQDCQQLMPQHRPSSTAEYPLFSANDPDPSKRGLVIPKAYLDPLAQKILQEVPMPNIPFDPQGRNYFGFRGVNGASNRLNVKVDHNLSSGNRMSARYTEVPNLADRYRVNKENLFFSLASDRSLTRQFAFTDTHVLSPRVVNEARANYTFADYSRALPGDLATKNYTREKFGLPNSTGWGYPRFNTGYGSYGFTGSAPGTYIEHQYQLSDDISIVYRHHNVSFGADLRLMMLNVKSSGLQDACCPTFAWAAAQTNSGNANTPGGTGGVQFASFLLGVPNSVNLRGLVIPYYYRWKTGAAYFQDDWRVRRNLTLNLGVRWQYNSPRSEKFNRQASADVFNPVEILRPNGDLQALTFNYLFSGYGGRSIYLEPVHKRNFEPRFGFAWAPRLGFLRDRKMVIRGGYGISHPPVTGRGRSPVPDFGAGTSGSWTYTRWANNNAPPRTQTVNPQFLVRLGSNQPVMNITPLVLEIPSEGVLCHNCPPVRDPRVPGGALLVFTGNASSPYVQTWNLTTQFELARSFVLTLAYLGHKGTHLYSPLIAINNPDPILYEELLNQGGDPNEAIEDPFGRKDAAGNLITTTLVNLMRPIPTAGDISVAGQTNSNSIYHAGTFSLERRYARGLGMRFNYTWGKSIDTASDANLSSGGNTFLWGDTRLQDADNLKANRSVSNFDTRHRLNLVMNLDLPFGRRRRFFTNTGKTSRLLISNWSLNAVGSLYSGIPFAPYLGDANGVPGGASGFEQLRPDVVVGVPMFNPRWSKSVANDVPYWNPEAFARPAYGNLGDAPRTFDYARHPWRSSLNGSIFRDFYPWENRRRSIQFRAEAFNVLNHVTFTTANGGNESPNLFSSAPPVSRTGLSLAGPIPYLVNLGGASFPVGTRENLLAASYNQNFGKLWRDRNGPARVIQFGLRISW
ncbi:MAG: carboxypeptidase regulatory-like domain-containing protein [Bryobacteraceae bacterium]